MLRIPLYLTHEILLALLTIYLNNFPPFYHMQDVIKLNLTSWLRWSKICLEVIVLIASHFISSYKKIKIGSGARLISLFHHSLSFLLSLRASPVPWRSQLAENSSLLQLTVQAAPTTVLSIATLFQTSTTRRRRRRLTKIKPFNLSSSS